MILDIYAFAMFYIIIIIINIHYMLLYLYFILFSKSCLKVKVQNIVVKTNIYAIENRNNFKQRWEKEMRIS